MRRTLVAVLFWEGAFILGCSRPSQPFHGFKLVLERDARNEWLALGYFRGVLAHACEDSDLRRVIEGLTLHR